MEDLHLSLASTAASFLANSIRTPYHQMTINTFHLTSRTACPPFLLALIGLLDVASESGQVGKGRNVPEAACLAIAALIRSDGNVASRVQTTMCKDLPVCPTQVP